jgi:nickel-dependent lactate racemase
MGHMTLYHASGSPTAELSTEDLRVALEGVLEKFEPLRRVVAVPPDYSRVHSRAGLLTCLAHDFLGDRLVDVIPAVGTHVEMNQLDREKMFPTIPADLFRYHNWRTDVETVGEVPADFVTQVTEGIYRKSWPAQLNRLVWQGGHDLILSIGQVVPHEVIGMANYNKNLLVGTGGVRGINESHYIGAVYGMQRIMGRALTPLRKILNYAQDHYCQHLPLLFVQTVIGRNQAGHLVVRGLFIGDDVECFLQACELSLKVNFELVPESLSKVIVYLDPKEFHSTWLGNKAIYRTRMAIADGGELVILAPGIGTFGEDPAIDTQIRKHGYRTTPEILRAVDADATLRENLSAAAHLIHGSSEGRFKITYCPGKLSQAEIEGVGYHYAPLAEQMTRYPIETMTDGQQTLPSGEQVYFVRNPALGLWAHRSQME